MDEGVRNRYRNTTVGTLETISRFIPVNFNSNSRRLYWLLHSTLLGQTAETNCYVTSAKR